MPSDQDLPKRSIGELIDERSRQWDANPNAPLLLNQLGLTELPIFLRYRRRLKSLDLSGNRLEVLPSWIGELSDLVSLRLDGNLLRRLPEEITYLLSLRDLHLEDNCLEELPKELSRLHLKKLTLTGNAALELPQSLMEAADAGEILRYYNEIRYGRGAPLRELKLLVVGRGTAGKTTLIKSLSGEKPDENEPETHSIAIRELRFGCHEGEVRTRVWDFGGQEILHSTHQFFLTERSLYVIVLEPRSGLAERDVEYWLRLIEANGGGSPAIVVLNWSRGRRWRVDEVRLRREFPFVVDFIATDGLHGDGIEALRQAIVGAIDTRMPDVWLPFPRKWRDIKDAVAGMRENYLVYAQYIKLCEQFGETDAKAQSDLACILHALGLALHFAKDPRLRDTRVLNPAWVTGGVYAVIRSASVAARTGQLGVEDMPVVLAEAETQGVIKAADYPRETHFFILDLMKAFELCYAKYEAVELSIAQADPPPSEETVARAARYLVPDLLPDFEPEMEEPWETAAICLRYGFSILSPALLPRFIVRTHSLGAGEPTWRRGVVLRYDNSVALIRAEMHRNEVKAFVLGGDLENRQVLSAMIRRELDSLRAELKMRYVEELRVAADPERWIAVDSLKELEPLSDSAVKLPAQPFGLVDVNVTEQLDKLSPHATRENARDGKVAQPPVRLFVSYSHADERHLNPLDLLLGALEDIYGLTPWRDRRLVAGERWDDEIRRRLEEMDVFMFVASAASLVSPYIKEFELRRARERHEMLEIEVVSVKLAPCAVDEHEYLGKLQRLAPKYKSIRETHPVPTAWEQVRKDLVPVIKRAREKKLARRTN